MQDDSQCLTQDLLIQMRHVFYFTNSTLKGQQLDLKSLFQMSNSDYHDYTCQLMQDLVIWSAQVDNQATVVPLRGVFNIVFPALHAKDRRDAAKFLRSFFGLARVASRML